MEAALQGPTGRTALGSSVLTIGRAPDNVLVVNDTKASSHHAEIRQVGGGQGYSVTDLGSTNGTFVNEQRLERNIPRVLTAGDRVRIGDTTFTYEASGVSPIAPTIYADAGNNAAYQPTVAALPPYQDTPPAYQNTPYSSYAPPPPPQPYAPPPQPYEAPAAIPAYVAPPPIQKKGNRWLPIVLAVVGVLVLACIGFFVIGYVNRSTPAKTLNTFCSAIKSADYQTAYNQLSDFRKTRISEADFARLFTNFSSCSVGAINENDPRATAPVTFFPNAGSSITAPTELLLDNSGIWKISAINFPNIPGR